MTANISRTIVVDAARAANFSTKQKNQTTSWLIYLNRYFSLLVCVRYRTTVIDNFCNLV
jgi:hypothetical protein